MTTESNLPVELGRLLHENNHYTVTIGNGLKKSDYDGPRYLITNKDTNVVEAEASILATAIAYSEEFSENLRLVADKLRAAEIAKGKDEQQIVVN